MDRDNGKQLRKNIERNVAPHPLWLSQRDVEILRLLDPEDGFHYLPTHWIHAFVGGDALRVASG